MKNTIKIILPVFISCFIQMITRADTETNETYLKILQASNDVQRVITVLPDVEKLWPQEPVAYLKSLNQIAHVSGGTLDSPSGKLLFLNAFTNLMQKSCPTNEADAAQWVNLKSDTILFYLNFDEIKRDQTRWLAIARFVGEIRSKRIPNYQNQGMSISTIDGSPDGNDKWQNIMRDNERKKNTDRFQSELSQADSVLVFFLEDGVSRFSPRDPSSADFIKQVSDAAHLTANEQGRISRKN